MVVLIKFRIFGPLRFLSHAEMLKLFHRACARAGIEVMRSQGFNPHPKLSLPLPRPVGVESDDELLCVRLDGKLNYQSPITNYQSLIKSRLSEQLPEGCELLSVGFVQTNEAIQPSLATYIVPIQPDYLNDKLRDRIERLLESKSFIVERRIDSKKLKIENRESKIKTVDVRPFIKSIEVNDSGVVIDCIISPAGCIRIEEILKLLEIDIERLDAPIRRTNIQYISREA